MRGPSGVRCESRSGAVRTGRRGTRHPTARDHSGTPAGTEHAATGVSMRCRWAPTDRRTWGGAARDPTRSAHGPGHPAVPERRTSARLSTPPLRGRAASRRASGTEPRGRERPSHERANAAPERPPGTHIERQAERHPAAPRVEHHMEGTCRQRRAWNASEREASAGTAWWSASTGGAAEHKSDQAAAPKTGSTPSTTVATALREVP